MCRNRVCSNNQQIVPTLVGLTLLGKIAGTLDGVKGIQGAVDAHGIANSPSPGRSGRHPGGNSM